PVWPMASAVAGAAAISHVPSGGRGPSPLSQRLKRLSMSVMTASIDGGLGHRAAPVEKVEVAALVGLRDMALVERGEGALVARRRRRPFGTPAGEFGLVDAHVEPAGRDIEFDEIAGPQEGQRPAHGCF